ncbi:hypothetical protein K488DRAFT_82449 [Vararia minispora EC-137]|uniref:Uncharacterized protein n=1 Tax=Vararia minispora EC-137 TaxID=1314806 RepID=A0ACB8QW35_9AGAM|nr:hypothetical protein K488DRAFT_82449 [Vararia minispora EC-137]
MYKQQPQRRLEQCVKSSLIVHVNPACDGGNVFGMLLHAHETNAFSAITITNLLGAQGNHGSTHVVPREAVLEQRTAPLDLIAPEISVPEFEDPNDPDELPPPPERRPSCLPPSRQLHIRGTLAKYLGGGRVGVVFALEDIEVVAMPDGFSLPPLVVKIARRDRVASLAREAWFYDEMECIQGSVIPRCYGWFELTLGHGDRVPVLEHFVKDKCWTQDDSEYLDVNSEALNGQPLHPLLQERVESRDIISVLVLEQVGDRLTPGRKLGPLERKDMIHLYKQLSELGIGVVPDVRWENLALKHPDVPNAVSPVIEREHSFRLIDFDQAFKSDWISPLSRFMESDLLLLVNTIERGDCGPRSYPPSQMYEVRWRQSASAKDCF